MKPSRRPPGRAKPSDRTTHVSRWRLGTSERLRRRAESALERSEHRYREIVENSLGLICTHDLAGMILSVNPAAARSLGYLPEEGPGRNLRDFLSPDTRPLFDEYLARVRQNKSDTGLMRVRARDGTERIWMYRNIVYEEPNGPAYVLGHALDVTERVLAEHALRESQRNLAEAYLELDARVQQRTAELRQANSRLLDEIAERRRADELRERALVRERNTLAFLASASDGLMTALNEDQTLTAVAHAPVPFLADWTIVHLETGDGSTRCTAGAHIDRDCNPTLERLAARWPSPPENESWIARALATGRPEIVADASESELRRWVGHDEECMTLVQQLGAESLVVVPLIVREATIGSLTLVSRTPERFTASDITIIEDLTRRFRLAAERARLYREAQDANRTKEEFLATLSHELRTPLNAILGWAHILRKRSDDPHAARGLAAIERNAEAQTRLIEDLLDVSRISSGKFPLNLEPVDLCSVVVEALDGVRPAAHAKGLQLIEPVDPPIVVVQGDWYRLQQVVSNLLSNAVKFTPTGGTVTIGLSRADGMASLTVTDTGVGIRSDVLPLVFDPFRQADSSATRAHGGLGLGLAIVRHLVERHGGTVGAHSAGAGKGAAFTVALPLHGKAGVGDDVGGETRRESVRALRAPAATGEPALQGRLILVVDDHADARELIREIIQHSGADVMTATTAPEALAALATSIPHLLIADIGLPGEDGYQLIGQMRALPPERGGRIPAIALTAYARAEDRARALAAGFQLHLVKPVDPGALVKAVAQVLATSR